MHRPATALTSTPPPAHGPRAAERADLGTGSPAAGPLAPMPDEALIGPILAGDTAAFELLMRRHNQRLYRIARSVLRSAADAEDAVQEAYLRAYTSLARFEGRSSLVAWLSRITFHEALRARRRLRRAAAAVESERLGAPGRFGDAPDADPLDRAEDRAMLTAAFDALPASLRPVVMLRLVEGLSTRQTAESLRMSEASVKVSLHRARKLLAEHIERRAVTGLRGRFAFAEERCDRIVAGVFRRLPPPFSS